MRYSVFQPGALLLLAFGLFASSTGCGKSENDTSAGATGDVKIYAVTGVVERVDLPGKKVVIAHEAIPGYMDAMTMPFNVKDGSELAQVKVSDRVAFSFYVGVEESWIAGLRSIGEGQAKDPPPAGSAGQQPADPKEDLFTFTNEFGRRVHLKDYSGRPLAMTFFFTRCPVPDYCPRLSKNFQEATAILKNTSNAPTNWQFLSVSIDPEYDTPERLRAYGKLYSYDSNHWSFLTGPRSHVENLARLFSLPVDKTNSLYNHGFRTIIINATNKVQQIFPVVGNLSQNIADEIIKAAPR